MSKKMNSIYGTLGPRANVPEQMKPIPGREADMVENNAGGYTFALDNFGRLNRFLILGSESGTFYVNTRALTRENAQVIRDCITENWQRTLHDIKTVSLSGRAKSNDPALFALAVMAASDNQEAKLAALYSLGDVARTGTHLFSFLTFVLQFRGWSRSLRSAVERWYHQSKTPYQVVKYRRRNGWTHRDVLRLAHVRPTSNAENAMFQWIVKGETDRVADLPPIVRDHITAMNKDTNLSGLVHLIEFARLPWEALPTDALKHPEIWQALLRAGMPMTAMLRNLGRMTAIAALNAEYAQVVIDALSDEAKIRASRIHPFAILAALRTYQSGHSLRGNLEWMPVRPIVAALENAFYLAFGNVEPTGKRILHALDISASMGWKHIDSINMTVREAAAAMMLVSMRVDGETEFYGFSHELRQMSLPDGGLNKLVDAVSDLHFGGTDASLPFIHAKNNRLDYDAVIVYTDDEVWAGRHVDTVLKEYTLQVGHPVKMVVIGMVANQFTIGDPNNPDILNVSGMDANVPGLVSDFIAGRLDVDFIDQEKPIPAFDDPDVGNPDAE